VCVSDRRTVHICLSNDLLRLLYPTQKLVHCAQMSNNNMTIHDYLHNYTTVNERVYVCMF